MYDCVRCVSWWEICVRHSPVEGGSQFAWYDLSGQFHSMLFGIWNERWVDLWTEGQTEGQREYRRTNQFLKIRCFPGGWVGKKFLEGMIIFQNTSYFAPTPRFFPYFGFFRLNFWHPHLFFAFFVFFYAKFKDTHLIFYRQFVFLRLKFLLPHTLFKITFYPTFLHKWLLKTLVTLNVFHFEWNDTTCDAKTAKNGKKKMKYEKSRDFFLGKNPKIGAFDNYPPHHTFQEFFSDLPLCFLDKYFINSLASFPVSRKALLICTGNWILCMIPWLIGTISKNKYTGFL